MRQGFIAAMLGVAAFIAFSPAYAAKSAVSNGPKIGVVDLQQVVGNSVRGRQANQTLQQKIQELQAKANDMNSKRQALKDQLDKADPKSSGYTALQKQFQDADGEFTDFVQESRQLIQQRQQELLQPIEQELNKVLNQYAKDNHYDIILSKGSGALIVSDTYDVTTGVTDALDKDWTALQKSTPTMAPGASTKGPAN